MDGHDAVLLAVSLDDRDRPRFDNKEVISGLTLTKQELPGTDGPDPSHPAQPRALVFVQAREGAVAVSRFLDPQSQRIAHGRSGTRNAPSGMRWAIEPPVVGWLPH